MARIRRARRRRHHPRPWAPSAASPRVPPPPWPNELLQCPLRHRRRPPPPRRRAVGCRLRWWASGDHVQAHVQRVCACVWNPEELGRRHPHAACGHRSHCGVGERVGRQRSVEGDGHGRPQRRQHVAVRPLHPRRQARRGRWRIQEWATSVFLFLRREKYARARSTYLAAASPRRSRPDRGRRCGRCVWPTAHRGTARPAVAAGRWATDRWRRRPRARRPAAPLRAPPRMPLPDRHHRASIHRGSVQRAWRRRPLPVLLQKRSRTMGATWSASSATSAAKT
jgi:hypothetical protein